MPEIGDRTALQRYVLARIDYDHAKTRMEEANRKTLQEQPAAMRYLQAYGTTDIQLNNAPNRVARLKISEPGIEVL